MAVFNELPDLSARDGNSFPDCFRERNLYYSNSPPPLLKSDFRSSLLAGLSPMISHSDFILNIYKSFRLIISID